MNRNVEAHFSEIPNVEVERSIFDRSCTHKTSFNVGDLIPFYVDEVLPGDSFRVTTSKVVRLQTMLTPIMDNIYLDTYFFFVPNRLIWSHWKEFMGENTSSAWVQQTTYQVPSISAPTSTGFATGTIADYLGLPVGVTWSATDPLAPSALPFRAYAKVCDDWFRSEVLTDPLNIPTGDTNQVGTNGGSYINDVANGGLPFKVAKYFDLFTSALPSPQKATNPVTFPLISGSLAPVNTGAVHSIGTTPLKLEDIAGGSHTSYFNLGASFSSSVDGDLKGVSASTPSGALSLEPSNLWADLSSSVGAVSINELRLAFQLQKFYEKCARGGLTNRNSGPRVTKIEEKNWKAA